MVDVDRALDAALMKNRARNYMRQILATTLYVNALLFFLPLFERLMPFEYDGLFKVLGVTHAVWNGWMHALVMFGIPLNCVLALVDLRVVYELIVDSRTGKSNADLQGYGRTDIPLYVPLAALCLCVCCAIGGLYLR